MTALTDAPSPDGTSTEMTGLVELYTGLPVVQSLLALLVVLVLTARPPVVVPTR